MAHPTTTPADLFALTRQGDLDALRSALDANPDQVHAIDPNPWCCRATLLNVAVGTGRKDLVDLLLDRGADPNRLSDWWAGGFSALASVRAEDRDWMVPHLRERGARLDAFTASMHGLEAELLELLKQDRFMVNQVAGDGQRPLHVAATPAISMLLVDRGADLEARCVDHGSTPAQYAAGARPEVCRLLLERGARPDVFMLSALGDVDTLSRLLEKDPELPNARYTRETFPTPGSQASHIYVYTLSDYGTTPLHFAVATEQPATVDWLAAAGADLHARGGYDDQTPLHVAAWKDRPAAIAALARAGADLNARSGPGHATPPVAWALVGGSPAALQALVDAGAEVTTEHLESARAGEKGAFEPHTRGTPEMYRQMQQTLERALNGG